MWVVEWTMDEEIDPVRNQTLIGQTYITALIFERAGLLLKSAIIIKAVV